MFDTWQELLIGGAVLIIALAMVWGIVARGGRIKSKLFDVDGKPVPQRKTALTDKEIERIAEGLHVNLVKKHQCFQADRLALIHEGGHVLAGGLAVALRNNIELGCNGNTKQALDDTVEFQAKIRKFQPAEGRA